MPSVCLFYFHFFALFFEFFYFPLFLAQRSFVRPSIFLKDLSRQSTRRDRKKKQILFLYYETKTGTNEFGAGIVCIRLCVFLITGFKRMKLSWSIIVPRRPECVFPGGETRKIFSLILVKIVTLNDCRIKYIILFSRQ